MKRLLITLSDEAVMIWQAYQVKEKIRNRDDALDQLICGFGGLAPAPSPSGAPFRIRLYAYDIPLLSFSSFTAAI